MTAASLTSVRDEYKEQTRSRILEAAAAIAREAGEEQVTIAAVAARAGVRDRTVYRHFKTREALVGSVWKMVRERVALPNPARTGDALIETPLLFFPKLHDERELVRAYLYSRAAREARVRPNMARQKVILECIRRELPDLDENELRRRAAIAQVLTSPYTWELMSRLWGFDGFQAGDAAAEALQVLLGRSLADEDWG
ncbi:MAG: TetR family transcriptional regulator [Sphingomicrobium sp.]